MGGNVGLSPPIQWFEKVLDMVAALRLSIPQTSASALGIFSEAKMDRKLWSL